MIYLNELSLKKEMVLINNSNKMKKDSSIKPHDNTKIIDELIEEYNKETYNIRKGKIEEQFTNEVVKCFIPDYTKEIFGEMVLMLIRNLLKKHSFSGYTIEWKADFSVDAIEKILKYMHNFNPLMISERTGKRSKSFAYLTQICTQAFISVINKRNEEKAKSKEYEVISYSSMYKTGFIDNLYHDDNSSSYQEKETYKEINVETLTEIIPVVQDYDITDTLKITYPNTIDSIPLDLYNQIMDIKPEKLSLIITKDYQNEEEEHDSQW